MTAYSIVAALAAIILSTAIRAASRNTLIRRKLVLSLVLFAAFALVAAARVYFVADKPAQALLDSIGNLAFALAAIVAIASLLLNPFRSDRASDYFPTIVQDAIIIGVFLLVGIFVLGEKWLTLSAVGGFVLGFALQDTLGNMFAGLAIQVEKPFRVGHWIAVGNYEGLVAEITWRATRLHTKAGTSVVLPNNIISKEAITNFSEPTAATRLSVDIGVSYDVPPNQVKRVLLEAIAHLAPVLKTPAPAVVVVDFGASAIVYRIKFWISDFAADDPARDEVRTAAYYALKRNRFEMPYPMQVQYNREEAPVRREERVRELDALVASVDVFGPLDEADRAALLAESDERTYGAGEPIVRQGQAGDSMFVIARGEVRVTLEGSGQEVARIGAGGYFGEMSLLTGEPRTATVSAVDDTDVLEINAATFRRLAAIKPTVIAQISLDVAARREGLERSREIAAVAVVPEARRTFLARVQKFLGFGS